MKWGKNTIVACGLLAVSSVAFAQDPPPDYSESFDAGYVTDGGDFDYLATGKTAADDVVENTAYVTYEVGTITQAIESNDPAARFRVDRVVLVNVANTDADNKVDVTPDEEDAYLTFVVRNDSNDALDLVLEMMDDTTDFDPSAGLFYETNGTPGFQPDVGGDTAVPLTVANGNVPILVNVLAETSRTVYVVGDIPDSSGVADGDTVPVTLLATAYEANSDAAPASLMSTIAAATENDTNESGSLGDGDGVSDTDGAMRLDTVLGDQAGSDAGDEERDGQHSSVGTFVVAAATIAVNKTSVVISDPFNGETNPKAIPGAEILYCIEVANTGDTTAANVSIRDPIPTGTTYLDGSIEVFTAAQACVASAVGNGNAITDVDSDTENVAWNGDYDAAAAGGPEVNTTVSSVAGPSGVTVTIFRVTID